MEGATDTLSVAIDEGAPGSEMTDRSALHEGAEATETQGQYQHTNPRSQEAPHHESSNSVEKIGEPVEGETTAETSGVVATHSTAEAAAAPQQNADVTTKTNNGESVATASRPKECEEASSWAPSENVVVRPDDPAAPERSRSEGGPGNIGGAAVACDTDPTNNDPRVRFAAFAKQPFQLRLLTVPLDFPATRCEELDDEHSYLTHLGTDLAVPVADSNGNTVVGAGSEEENQGGLFVGQLPSTITTLRLVRLIQTLANLTNCKVTFKRIILHRKNGVCAFVVMNPEAVPKLASLDEAVLLEDVSPYLWYADTATKKVMLSEFLSMRRDWPRKGIVLEVRQTFVMRGGAGGGGGAGQQSADSAFRSGRGGYRGGMQGVPQHVYHHHHHFQGGWNPQPTFVHHQFQQHTYQQQQVFQHGRPWHHQQQQPFGAMPQEFDVYQQQLPNHQQGFTPEYEMFHQQQQMLHHQHQQYPHQQQYQQNDFIASAQQQQLPHFVTASSGGLPMLQTPEAGFSRMVQFPGLPTQNNLIQLVQQQGQQQQQQMTPPPPPPRVGTLPHQQQQQQQPTILVLQQVGERGPSTSAASSSAVVNKWCPACNVMLRPFNLAEVSCPSCGGARLVPSACHGCHRLFCPRCDKELSQSA